MKKIMFRKVFVVGIIILFVCIGFTSSSYSLSMSKSQTFGFEGNILYVGGSGEGNYSKIQDAINDASNGDTIYVYEKRYYENLYVNKSITIIGQNRKNTIVDGSHKDTHSIRLVTDKINISNFTFYNKVGPQRELAFYILCDNCYISDCTIYTNVKNALGIESASYNTFFNCSIHTITAFGGGDAIRLMSSYNTFINCEIFNNRRFGALIYGSHNSFLNCSFHDNGEAGIRMDGNANIFSGCIFYDNDIGFKIDESRDHIILNCTIYNNNDGIRLWQYHPKNVTIRNCDIFNNKKVGIRIIQDTVKTTVDNCRIYNNGIGITIADDSLYNTVIDSTIYDNNNYGIYLSDSTQNTITSNCLINDGIYVKADNNVIDNNTVNGKPLVYLEGESDTGIDVDAGQIILVNCDNITIQNHEISNTDVGIDLWSTHNCFISGNTITSNNKCGIIGFLSNSNTISDNEISNNGNGINLYENCRSNIITNNNISMNNNDGIYLDSFCLNNLITGNSISSNSDEGINLHHDSFYNYIYRNNFLNNGENAYDEGSNIWDDGKYGNFWSDYEERYPNAKPKLFKPWMWDTPYEIPGGGDSKDMCPLVKQWSNSALIDIPRNKANHNSLFLRLLERFPILQKLLHFME